MSEDELVRFLVAKDLIHAEIIKGLLESSGIPCFIRDKGQLKTWPHAARIWTSGVVMEVPASRLEKAHEIYDAAREAGKLLDENFEINGDNGKLY